MDDEYRARLSLAKKMLLQMEGFDAWDFLLDGVEEKPSWFDSKDLDDILERIERHIEAALGGRELHAGGNTWAAILGMKEAGLLNFIMQDRNLELKQQAEDLGSIELFE